MLLSSRLIYNISPHLLRWCMDVRKQFSVCSIIILTNTKECCDLEATIFFMQLKECMALWFNSLCIFVFFFS